MVLSKLPTCRELRLVTASAFDELSALPAGRLHRDQATEGPSTAKKAVRLRLPVCSWPPVLETPHLVKSFVTPRKPSLKDVRERPEPGKMLKKAKKS